MVTKLLAMVDSEGDSLPRTQRCSETRFGQKSPRSRWEASMRRRQIFVVVAASCLLALTAAAEGETGAAETPQAAGIPAAHVIGSPTSSCGTDTVYPAIPSGVDPTTLSSTDLAAYGLPARPSSASGAAALASWTQALKAAKTYVPPSTPACAGPTGMFGLGQNESADTVTPEETTITFNGNWSGFVVTDSNFNSVPFIQTQSQFTVPAVAANSSYSVSSCGNGSFPPNVATWTGMGHDAIIQTGIISCSTTTPTYRMWTEDYPAGPRFEGVAIAPGNTIFVEAQWDGNNTCYYFQDNLTTGNYTSHTHTDCIYRGEHYADFMLERASKYYLPNFASYRQLDNEFEDANYNFGGLYSVSRTVWSMTSDCQSTGFQLALTSSVSSSDNGFYHGHNADDPVCNR